MIRYGKITEKNKREIVLLKGYPCVWGRCSFCDYIEDNSCDEAEMSRVNEDALSCVTGEYAALEVINSGSVFELPNSTLDMLKSVIADKKIQKLYFEAYYGYRERLREITEFFGIDIVYKCGIETFDDDFRNDVLKKGIVFSDPEEVAEYFDSVCLLVGVKGQTKEMIHRDIKILLEHFPYGCINLYTDNTTAIVADEELKSWFKETYGHMEDYPNIDVLWSNDGFGVGGESI